MAVDSKLTNPNVWAFKIISFFMSVSLMVSSFFLKSAWDRISTLEIKIHQMEIVMAERTTNIFTSEDWIREKIILDTKNAALESRLIRLEENIPYIKDALSEIKKSLGNK